MHSPEGGVPFRAISSGLHWALVVAVFRLLRPFVLGLAKTGVRKDTLPQRPNE